MNSILIIREICIDDYKEIHILNGQLGYKYPLEKVKKQILRILNETNDKVFVGIINEKVLAYIHLSPYELLYHDSLINVLGFIVNEEYRRRGIGKRMMEYAEKWTQNNGYKGIRLVSGWNRKEAHKFYISCGFKNRKNQKNFYKLF